jgi:hypothetical protein
MNRILLPTVLTALALVSGCDRRGDEAPRPAPPAAVEQAPAGLTPSAGNRVLEFKLGENVVQMEVAEPSPSLTAEGKGFYYYRLLREAVIREQLAQIYDRARSEWNASAVRERFERDWGTIRDGFERLGREIEAQRLFAKDYLERKATNVYLQPADYYRQLVEAGRQNLPFASSVEWERFHQLFPTLEDIDTLAKGIPETVEEAWRIHGQGLIADAFGEHWVLGKLRQQDPEIDSKLVDRGLIGQAVPDLPHSLSQPTSQEDVRKQLLNEMRNRMALAEALETIDFKDAEIGRLFKERARQELLEPMPHPFENVQFLGEKGSMP